MKLRRPAIIFILATLFLDVLGIGLVIPVMPKLVEEFQGGNVSTAAGTMGLLAAIYSLMQFLFAPLLGSLSDRFGRRPILLASLLGSGLDYLLLAWAPSISWFFLGRLVSGITGASFSTASAYIADVSPPEKRAQSFGLIGAAFGIGFIAGPVLGGVLSNFSLRLPFIAAAVLTLVNWLFGLLAVPESLPQEQRRAFAWRRANPVGSLLALRNYPVALGLTSTLFLVYLAHNTMPGIWVLYTGYRYHWNAAETGVSLAMIGIVAALVQGGLVRIIIPRFGERKALVTGLIISSCNLAGYGLASQGWMIYVIMLAGSLGAIGGPALQSLISKSVPGNEQGAVQGALSSLANVASLIGQPMATTLFGYFISPKAPWFIPGAAFFISALLMLAGMMLALFNFRKTSEAG
jgi:DHA1 family tetracycline resistance protein-like MFS transporter